MKKKTTKVAREVDYLPIGNRFGARKERKQQWFSYPGARPRLTPNNTKIVVYCMCNKSSPFKNLAVMFTASRMLRSKKAPDSRRFTIREKCGVCLEKLTGAEYEVILSYINLSYGKDI